MGNWGEEMNHLKCETVRLAPSKMAFGRRTLGRDKNSHPNVQRGNMVWAIGYLLIAAYLLFAHGCHSEADTELSTFISESASATAER